MGDTEAVLLLVLQRQCLIPRQGHEKGLLRLEMTLKVEQKLADDIGGETFDVLEMLPQEFDPNEDFGVLGIDFGDPTNRVFKGKLADWTHEAIIVSWPILVDP
jgi:hypothetical protein